MKSICVALVLCSLLSLIAGQGAPVVTYNTTVDCSLGCDFDDINIWQNGFPPVDGSIVVIAGNGSLTQITTTQVHSLAQLNITGASVSFIINSNFTVTGTVYMYQGPALGIKSNATVSGIAAFGALISDPITAIQTYGPSGIYLGSGSNIASQTFTMVPDPNAVFQCVQCVITTPAPELGSVTILDQLVVGPNSFFAVHDITAITVTLAANTNVSVVNSFVATGYVQLDATSILMVATKASFTNLEAEDDTPPLSGSGKVVITDATVNIDESSPTYTPFMGTLVIGGNVNIEFQTISLTQLSFLPNANVSISARGLNLQTVVGGVIPGSIVASRGASSTLGLELSGSVTVTGGIQATADIQLSPGAFLNLQESNIQVTSAKLSTNDAVITAQAITITHGLWEAHNTTTFVPTTTISNSSLTLYTTGNVFNGNLAIQDGSSLAVLLALNQVPLKTVTATVSGTLMYSFQDPPTKPGMYTVLQTEQKLDGNGHFTGLPVPINGESVVLKSIVYQTNSIELSYDEKVKSGGGSKWWISIIVLLIVGAAAGGGYFYYRRRKTADYQQI